MSEDIKEVKVSKKSGTAIKFDGTYQCVYKIIDKYASIFGKYNAVFLIDYTYIHAYPFDHNPKPSLRLTITSSSNDHWSKQKLELETGRWIVFMGSDIKIYKDNEFKATFEEQESK